MLILFDIDATLITTSRSGMLSMGDAGRTLFGPGFRIEGTDFAGRLDPLILADLMANNGLEATPTRLAAMRDGYRRALEKRLAAPGVRRALPGVLALLERLRGTDRVTLGLLTGNFPETGRMKLRACGIDPEWFAVQVWGDESPFTPPRRDHLPPVGIARCAELRACGVPEVRATVVGDTVHDIACARAHGCRSLGVATGQYGVDQLAAAGADRVERDLSGAEEIAKWLADVGGSD